MPIPSAPRAPFLLPALAVVVLAACAGRSAKSEPFALVSIEDTERMMKEPDVVVIDANRRDTFETNRLPGSRHYKAAPFAEVLPPDRDTRLVFYCASPT